jgi:hypothetical protein
MWLRHYLACPVPPLLVSPAGATGVERNPTLLWRAAATATSYHVQAAPSNAFTAPAVDTTVTDTAVRVSPLAATSMYYWHVSASNDSGASSYSPAASFITGDQILSVSAQAQAPPSFALMQNYPNPWNPATTIPFTLPARSDVRIVLVNLLGQTVRVIASGTYEAGEHRVRLDGGGLASGVYLYRMEAGPYVSVRKLVLLR